MKRLTIILLILISLVKANAQQDPLYTQFMFNPFVINPAITGSHTYYQIWLNSRLQWMGLPDAPVTNTLSIYGPFEKLDMGVGGYVYSDVTGPTSRLGFKGAYAYNFAINDEYRLSFGLFAGMLQYKIDNSEIKFGDYEPESINKEVYYLPDAAIGAYFYSSNLHAGISADQLLNNKIPAFEEDSLLTKDAFGRLKSHFYITGGYRYFINRDLALEPTLILRVVKPATPQLDFNVRVIFQNMAWGGISFRSQDALAFVGGYTYQNKIFIGLSYDIGVTKLAKYNYGSFEAVIGYKFDSIKD